MRRRRLFAAIIACAVLHVKSDKAAKVDSCNAPVEDTKGAPAEFQNAGGSRPVGLPFATRSSAWGTQGMAATSQPLSTQAALRILQQGGSAIDAAIAANAMEGVVEPMMNGIGGDIMVMLWDEQSSDLIGYNGAGRAAEGFSLEDMQRELLELGEEYIPMRGPLSVTVPGAVKGWCDLSERYGKLSLAEVLQPAIHYATYGYPVTEVIAADWVPTWDTTSDNGLTSGGRFPDAGNGFREVFTPGGTAPREGDIFKNPDLAHTLTLIGEGGCDAFYHGEIAQKIAEFAEIGGTKLTLDDMANHRGEFVTPVNVTYREEYRVFELPPNPQGLAALQMLNVLEGFQFGGEGGMAHNSADYLHTLVEAKKLAFADAATFYADPDFVDVPVEGLLSKEYAAERRQLVNMSAAALSVEHGDPRPFCDTSNKAATKAFRETLEGKYGGDTIYLTVADEDGNMVSLIQSLYNGFGSGMVVPGLGFPLQDRGALFAVEEGHANAYAPLKRPFHTIMPGFVTKNEEPYLSFGVMGGFMQPQGQVQTLLNIVEYGMNVQEAGDAARFYHTRDNQPTGQVMEDGGTLELEGGVCQSVIEQLVSRGHNITRKANQGGYQAIMRQTNGSGGGGFVYNGATEMRKDGVAMGY